MDHCSQDVSAEAGGFVVTMPRHFADAAPSTFWRTTTDGALMFVARTANPVAIPRTAVTTVAGRVRTRALSANTVLMTAFGEIDAASADELSENVERHLIGYRQLVLDLSGLTFFGTAGYSVLHRVHSRCLRTATDWVLVPGKEVDRLLRVCDPDGILPTAPNIVSAVAALARSHTGQVG
jgi:anti-anti-sigma factor